MPVGDLPGWKQVFTEDFTDGDVAIGGFPGQIYSAKWSENYFDGTPDTAGKRGKNSGYYPSKVLSVHDGLLDFYLHTENGVSMGAAPSPKFAPSSERPFNSQTYGRYAVRFKSDALKGFKLAWLLWPDSKQWPQDGELNFPEGDLSTYIYAAMHGTGAKDNRVDLFRTETPFTGWHTAVMEWSPGRVEYFLDGQSIGVSMSDTPNKPMHYILQTESCVKVCPAPGASAHVYVDWVAIWERSPASSLPVG
ncbi:glycosyl hydrolase family protein [Arthrobacter crusticola]|uniref:Glycosyl hydrolase family protein n=2 Tax=Arthrobacter crusticola TaxID=2547960 RepID=A0A4R5TTK9_9MICC|nr:glycosyl hydrolase family protein [Arthrobacter crusticola]